MYGYDNTATGFSAGDMREAAHDCTHNSSLQQYGGPKSDPNSKPDLSNASCKKLHFHRFNAKCNSLVGGF